MDLTEKLISYFRKPEEETRNEAPQGLCSLCWGYQQYDGKIRDVIKDKQIDVNNHKESYLLIQDFVKQNLEGIKLKEGEIHSCPTCNCEEEKQNGQD